MFKQKSRYAKARWVFLVLFLLSTFLLIWLPLFMFLEGPPDDPSASRGEALIIEIAAVTSCLTSVTTFIGFVSTTLLAWRKDKREATALDQQRRLQEIQIEKAELELSSSLPTCPDCGTANRRMATFCIHCGTRLSPPPDGQ